MIEGTSYLNKEIITLRARMHSKHAYMSICGHKNRHISISISRHLSDL